MTVTLVDAIMKNAKERPEKKAVCFRNDVLTYGELAKKICVASAFLKQLGVKKGDRVVITAVSKPEYVVGLAAIQNLGAVSVPLDKNAKEFSVIQIVDAVTPVLMISDTQKCADKVEIISLKKLLSVDVEINEEVKAVVEDGDILEMLFTTGTTGKPKGAMLTKKCLYANMCNTFYGIGMRPDDVILLPLPLNHSFGMRVLRSTFYAGATLVLQNGFSFAKEIENNIEKYDCTGLVAVSASMEVILGQMQDRAKEVLGKLRYIEISAGSLSSRLRKKIPEMLPNTELHNTWGSTESGGALFLNLSKHPEKIASIGKPLDNIELKVLDEQNKEITGAGFECSGRMAIKGDMQMIGYWNMPELTETTLVDGWLLTSDLVYRDEDGYVYMLGRADDIINVGGEKVSPIEVENVAGQNEHVREAACIGVADPDGITGQTPALFVVARDAEYSDEQLKIYLSERMEKYKVPTQYVLVREIPKNRMKKTDRKALRQMWDRRDEQDLMNPVMQAIFSRRSIRRFKEEKIPKNILEMIVQAGYYAPSGHNMQTWKFTVINTSDNINRLKEATVEAAKLADVMCYGFENPQSIILISNDERNPYGCQDSSAAAENMFLAAYSYGLGSVWLNPLMTLRNVEPIKSVLDEFGIPENHKVWCMVALGYPETEGNILAKKQNVVTFVD